MSCFSSQKNQKGEGMEVFFFCLFFNTEKMILDCAYNEWTETVQLVYLNWSQIVGKNLTHF